MRHNFSDRQQPSIASWIVYSRCNQIPESSTKLRLFCFPCAGAGAMLFRDWGQDLLPEMEIACIRLPGREALISEPLQHHLPDVIQRLTLEILPHLTIPFAFFGHSMGGLIAFELTRSLYQNHHPLPQHLFISACNSPQSPRHHPPRHTLSDVDLVGELRRLGGTPEAVLNNAELTALLLPIVRADLSVVDTYRYSDQMPLPLPITVLAGLNDPEISLEQLIDWKTQTTSDFNQQLFPGGHFFIQQQRSQVIRSILNRLRLEQST